MAHSPLLCIGLPIYNGGTYLTEALDSLLGQSFGDFQVVVSDNASTDATPDICLDFARRDRRLLYTRVRDNIGAGPNFNRVFTFCHSPYFKWMAHDDKLAPAALESLVGALERDPDAVLAHSKLDLIDDSGWPLQASRDGRILDAQGRPFHRLEPPHLAEGPRPSQRFGEALRRMNWCTAVFGVVRSEGLAATHLHGSYYEADRVLLAELALLGRFIQLDEPLMVKRCHGGVSVLKPYREQARMINPAVVPGPKGLRLRLGYLRALAVGRLSLRERLACTIVVVRVSLRNRLLLRLLTWVRDRARTRLPQTEHTNASHPDVP